MHNNCVYQKLRTTDAFAANFAVVTGDKLFLNQLEYFIQIQKVPIVQLLLVFIFAQTFQNASCENI